MSRLARRLHRFLMLLVGGQIFLWAMSGLYMVWFDIHYIHGDHFVKGPPVLSSSSRLEISFKDALSRFPEATSIILETLRGEPVYRLMHAGETVLISGLSGDIIEPLSDKRAAAIAISRLNQPYEVDSVTLLRKTDENDAVGQRGRPLWRVEFKGLFAPILYISQDSGSVEYIRHAPWQLFDWLWRIHIMDYQDGDDVSNALLVTMTILGLLASLMGVVLLPRSWSSARKVID
ncbi:MAG: peptidase [Alteromonas sp.]|jgi:hypothetical protein|uniref:peptidase n=1 Tax=Alteromonas sp. R78001 TaxID=3093865 RepID=UPI00020A67EC|nr:PepSY-associated TM helix domain-containing protein [Glaciecola sp. 4H-3-7+YE-5]MAB94183.1 peptidase [Alteromonas sp.]